MHKLTDAQKHKTYKIQYHIENMNKCITSQEIELVITNHRMKKSPGPDVKFHQIFREELVPIFIKFFPKIKEKEILPNSSYETGITITLKPRKG